MTHDRALWNFQSQNQTAANMDLRSDDTQWLIQDEPSVTATVRALEVFALGVVGRLYEQHDVLEVRALGNVMSKVAETRTRHMLGLLPDEPAEASTPAIQAMVEVAGWLSGQLDKPVAALDQLHAAVCFFDCYLSNVGVSGEGWSRNLVRGDGGR